MVSKYYHSLPCVRIESVGVGNGGTMRDREGSTMGDCEGSMDDGGGMGLGKGLANDGLAGGDGGGITSVRTVTETGGDETRGSVTNGGGGNETMTSISGTVTGISGTVTYDLFSQHGGNTSGGTIESSLLGLDGVDRLPRVIFSSVDGLTMDLGSLVVYFTDGIYGGAGVVAGINVGLDGGASNVSG